MNAWLAVLTGRVPTAAPAAACDPSGWTVSRLPCGPWVAGYDCGQSCAVCDVTRGWTCAACPDGSAAARM